MRTASWRLSFLGAILSGWVVAEAPPAGVSAITIRLTPERVLVGEPVVVLARFVGTGAPSVNLDLYGQELMITKGEDAWRFLPQRWTSYWSDSAPVDFRGGPISVEYVLTCNEVTRDWAFRSPGEYRLLLRRKSPTGGLLTSNEARLIVEVPGSREADLWQEIQQLPRADVCANEGFYMLSGAMERLIREYSDSRYLQYHRARDLRDRLDGDDVWGFERDSSSSQEERGRKRAALLGDLLARAQALVALKGPHEPSALLSLARVYQERGDMAAYRSTLETIIRQHAGRSVVPEAQERLRALDAAPQ